MVVDDEPVPGKILGPGEVIGDSALLYKTPRTASVLGIEETFWWELSAVRLYEIKKNAKSRQ